MVGSERVPAVIDVHEELGESVGAGFQVRRKGQLRVIRYHRRVFFGGAESGSKQEEEDLELHLRSVCYAITRLFLSAFFRL